VSDHGSKEKSSSKKEEVSLTSVSKPFQQAIADYLFHADRGGTRRPFACTSFFIYDIKKQEQAYDVNFINSPWFSYI